MSTLAVVQGILNCGEFLMRDIAQVHAFGQVLANESIGLFVGAALPRAVGIAEEDFHVPHCRPCGGVQMIAAITPVAELQDFMRFGSQRQLMAYVGLVPGEHSSGPKRRQGSITKAGNSAARRMLVEIAWHYQHSPRVSPIIAARHDHLLKPVTDIAWAVQLPLHGKFRRLLARHMLKNKAVVEVAREVAVFVWAIGRAVQ